MSPRIYPGDFEDEDDFPVQHNDDGTFMMNDISNGNHGSVHSEHHHRGFRRRFFLFLTEPSSSWGSAMYFFVLIVTIFASNLIIIMQTMSAFQYTPTNCGLCGAKAKSGFVDDMIYDDQTVTYERSDKYECQCPPKPYPYLENALNSILIFFAIEWSLRVLSYVPAHPRTDLIGKFGNWLKFLTSTPTLIDALAIWPYFIEINFLPAGLISLRLLRLFRVFQLVRLGKYNTMFVS